MTNNNRDAIVPVNNIHDAEPEKQMVVAEATTGQVVFLLLDWDYLW